MINNGDFVKRRAWLIPIANFQNFIIFILVIIPYSQESVLPESLHESFQVAKPGEHTSFQFFWRKKTVFFEVLHICRFFCRCSISRKQIWNFNSEVFPFQIKGHWRSHSVPKKPYFFFFRYFCLRWRKASTCRLHTTSFTMALRSITCALPQSKWRCNTN